MNYEELAKLRINYNKPIILSKLQELNISFVEAEYSGGGDDGSINELTPIYNDNPNEMPALEDCKVKVKHAYSYLNRETGEWFLKIEDKDESLKTAIETLCYDIISTVYAGWENNEGGYGYFKFNAEDGKINWSHTEYYISENTNDYVY